ncbi:MAG: WD40/YVTN/BNR-like repeat-containing protein, partial [Acidimicrobiia bacterium]
DLQWSLQNETPKSLHISQSHPDTLYVVGNERSGSATCLACGQDTLHVTINGGETWSKIFPTASSQDPSSDNSPSVLNHFLIDPLDPKELWTTGSDRDIDEGDLSQGLTHPQERSELFHSRDGGKSWESLPYDRASFEIKGLAVFHSPGKPSRIAFSGSYLSENRSINQLWWSTDGGKSWTSIPSYETGNGSGSLGLIRNGATVLDLFVVGHTADMSFQPEVYRLHPTTRSWIDMDLPRTGYAGCENECRPQISQLENFSFGRRRVGVFLEVGTASGDFLVYYRPR